MTVQNATPEKPFRTRAREAFEDTLEQSYHAMLVAAGGPARVEQIPRQIYRPYKALDLVSRFADPRLRYAAFDARPFKALQTLALFGEHIGQRLEIGLTPAGVPATREQADSYTLIRRAAQQVQAALPGVIEPVKNALETGQTTADFADVFQGGTTTYIGERMLQGLVKSASSLEGIKTNSSLVLLGAVANAQGCQLELSFVAPPTS